MTFATFSDRFKHRYIFVLTSLVIALTGFSILIAVHDRTHLEYAAIFLATMGIYSAMPVVLCWFNTNLGGHLRRSVGTAWQIGFGNIGGIIAAFSFLSKDAPKYTSGFGICLGFICLSAVANTVYFSALIAENKKRDRGHVKGLDLPDDEKLLMGDLNPDYRYML
jgi:MFS family permease